VRYNSVTKNVSLMQQFHSNSYVERASLLAPFLMENASETEAMHKLPNKVFQELSEAGFFKLMLPPGLGGIGPDLRNHLEVVTKLGVGCGSAAWIVALMGYQNYLLGWYPPDVQREIRKKSDLIYTGLVMGPPVFAKRVKGGYSLNGRWPYVSGAHYANWFLLSARDPEHESRVLTCLVPATNTNINDDWHALGLRGSGSVSVDCRGVFVPEDRILCFREAEKNGVPGAAVNDSFLFQGIPTSTMFALVVAAPSLGMAESSITLFSERIRTRKNARMPSLQTDWPSSQARLGRARTFLKRARLAYFDAVDAFTETASKGKNFSLDLKASLRMDAVETVRTCTEIVYTLFCDAGTGATLEGSHLQRIFRDIHTLRSHFMIMPDVASENFGRISLGLEPNPPYQGG